MEKTKDEDRQALAGKTGGGWMLLRPQLYWVAFSALAAGTAAALLLPAAKPAPASVAAPHQTSVQEAAAEPLVAANQVPGEKRWQRLQETLTVSPVVVGMPEGPLLLSALVADTEQARVQGLSGVEQVPEGFAMLFVFDDLADHGGFWMKGTRIPLDVVFLAGDPGQGREVAAHVLAVVPMVPCTADPCPVYTAPGPYLAALEVPPGTLSALQPGTRVWFVRPESGR